MQTQTQPSSLVSCLKPYSLILHVLVLKVLLYYFLASQWILCDKSVRCAGHERLMTPSNSALDRVRLAQNADSAHAVRSGAFDDSAQRQRGRMRGAEDGENHPPNTATRAHAQKKR